MKVCVIYERSADGGWGAYPPGLPGVGVVGRTIDEVRERVVRAIELHVRDMSDGELVEHDTPGDFAELIEVGAPIPDEAHWAVLRRAGLSA